MSREVYDNVEPERFTYLVLVLMEHLNLLRMELSRSEKRMVYVNIIYDIAGFSWNDYWTGMLRFLMPAANETSRLHITEPRFKLFIVNANTYLSWILNDLKGDVSCHNIFLSLYLSLSFSLSPSLSLSLSLFLYFSQSQSSISLSTELQKCHLVQPRGDQDEDACALRCTKRQSQSCSLANSSRRHAPRRSRHVGRSSSSSAYTESATRPSTTAHQR